MTTKAASPSSQREAAELIHFGCVLSDTPIEPPTEAELEQEFYRPDLDYLQDLREAEGLGDYYTQFGVLDE